ncbi:MAG: L,D-transpeptidase family protein, partial [Bacteroidota bacterium]
KREGDGKTPAGLFWVSAVFGKDPEYKEQCKMPFIHVGPTTEAIDDPKSRYYNQIVSADLAGEKDWTSSEKMYEISSYNVGVFINHNSPVQDPAAGSCIFIHEWRAPHKPTAGCVALATNNLKELAEWLDIKKKPTIVMLPMKEYRSHMLRWSLHRMPFDEYLAPTD